MKKEEVHRIVQERYGRVANNSESCCCGSTSAGTGSCCNTETNITSDISKHIGYSDADLNKVPDGANLGLGCGNPVALASLKKGEVVLDLGSGAGVDCFLTASRVGRQGKVIGVDMTPEMLDRARTNARKGKYKNVEFRLGEIENLPVADNTVDAIISNCVINLSPNKKKVFQEAFRVLKPGGRLMVSDMVILKKLPPLIKNSIAAYVGCIAGAISKNEYLKAVKAAGFQDVQIVDESLYPLDWVADDPESSVLRDDLEITAEQLKELASAIASIKAHGVKPE